MQIRFIALLLAAATLSACSDDTGPVTAPQMSAQGNAPFIAFDLAASERHVCAIAPGSSPQCWGANTVGQVGDGSIGPIVTAPERVGNARFESITTGIGHSCGLDRDGAAWCWGTNAQGQLGDGNTANSTAPVAVAGGHRFAAISAAGNISCGLTDAGSAYCWGSNVQGRLGAVTTQLCGVQACSRVPIAVQGGLEFTQISAGLLVSCAISTNGGTYCWGTNGFRTIGNGGPTSANYNTPQLVAGGHSFVLITVGGPHACALTAEGAAFCWGFNQFGALGSGALTDSGVPVAVSGGLSFSTIRAAGANSIFDHTCAVTTAGELYCWGTNHFGQLATTAPLGNCGIGAQARTCSRVPLRSETDLSFDVLRLGQEFSCGITQHKVYCWGSNVFGALGNASVTGSTPEPTPVSTWEKGAGRKNAPAIDPATLITS